jgi:response regulator RpfG family c-di-GMP phosphodiesterase
MIQSQCFTDEERIVLSASSWIYDIGLLSMDKATVQKFMYREEKCSDEERVLFRTHPIMGQKLAAFVNPLRGLGVTIRAHHERYDGMGYPDSLAGESIPWAARCLAVAVAFVEAGLPKREAAAHLQEQSGRRFDPEAVRLFFKTNSIVELPANIREVLLSDLEVGMRLARGIASPSGMLLVPSGRELDAVAISKLKNHSHLNLLSERLLIYA